MSRETCGAPRIHFELRERRRRVRRRRVARLIGALRIEGVSRRRFRTTVKDGEARPAADLVERNFVAEATDRLWVADITHVPTATLTLYMAVIVDACGRRIVGWGMATDLRTSLVLAALAMAVERRQPRGVIHHSDQGSRYISLAFGHHCRRSGIRPSTSSVGDRYDDAMAESFFATLECELPDRTASPTPWSPGTRFFRFIEGWHNARRRHSARGYPSPVAFEERFRGPA